MTRCLASVFFAATLTAVPVYAQAPSSLTLNDALARAADANPAMRAARSSRAVDLAGVAAAEERPNPEIGVEAARETPHWAFSGTVPVELGGKRARRVEVASATLAVTDAETVRIAADVRADVRRAYFVAVASERRIVISQELETIATRARDAAQDRFRTGAAPRLEALQAELALAEALNDLAAARGEAGAARAELNALLAYPVDSAPALADALDAGPMPGDAVAVAQAIAGNAELDVLQKRIDEARARLALATAMRRPDPSFTGTLTYDAPGEFTVGWRAAAAVALPIFTTGRPAVAAAQAAVTHAEAERDARAAQIAGAVTAAAARVRAAAQTAERYRRDLLPASAQIEAMADESYRAGQSGLPAYLQALQSARDVRQRALDAALAYQLALAELERAMGIPIR
jgi:cobalt-zinc-cadmium efflux system outer membrane protein